MKTEDQKTYIDYISRNRTGKKPNKKKALQALERLIDVIVSSDEDTVGQAVLHIPALLDFFSEPVQGKIKSDPVAWAVSLANPKETADYRKHAFAFKGDIWGCCGALACIAKGKADGVPDCTIVNPDGTFQTTTISGLQYDRVLPDKSRRVAGTVKSKTITGTGKTATYWLEFSDGQAGKYNAHFYDTLTAHGESGLWVAPLRDEKDRLTAGPLVGIETPERLGILMAIRHGYPKKPRAPQGRVI